VIEPNPASTNTAVVKPEKNFFLGKNIKVAFLIAKIIPNYPAKLRLKPTLACGTAWRGGRQGRRARKENNLQRIEKPNGLEQLGFSIRWKKLAPFAKVFGAQNPIQRALPKGGLSISNITLSLSQENKGKII
jgi:hypothetical protein